MGISFNREKDKRLLELLEELASGVNTAKEALYKLTDALDDGEIELIKDEWQRLNEPLASIVDYQADVLEPMIEELKENQ